MNNESQKANVPATRVVTTSWDDGDSRDLRIADMLAELGMAGTFYVPISGYPAGRRLSASELRQLSHRFDIGAHTLSHKSLSECPRASLRDEIAGSKQQLEQITGRAVPMFCYPNGRYNRDIIDEVRNAGFAGARTCRMMSTALFVNAYEMPVSVQAYPHATADYIRNCLRALSPAGLMRYAIARRRCADWLQLGKALFDDVLQNGGIWHLYGHSWEIDALNLWPDLQNMLAYVSGRPGVHYLTNGGVIGFGNTVAPAQVAA